MGGQKTLLRHLRREREISIALLSVKTGINKSTLSMIERQLQKPTEKQKTKLAKFFNRPADELLSEPTVAA